MAFDTREPSSRTEAVGLFASAQELERAVKDLETAGFDRSELSILASEDAIRRRLGRGWLATGELADQFAVPRSSHEESESLAEARGGIVAAAAYVPAMVGGVIMAASGGTMLAVVAVALASCGIGGAVGLWLARMFGREHATAIAGHLRNGGLLLWVYTRDAAHEARALDLLRAAGATDVHLHTLPSPGEPTEAERFAPVIRPENRIVY
ncbi:hypothetical protein [Ancylobacter oerskovii]|uniref:DUF1269 domain-containing protein n=1 Tax=Ancylobacter oerskovii TaxID=459519 RepID=A0ABW4YRK2_9HYPH|nr:hypothetical protein [Ancylobacter oerskovii]MBS7545442.1 hypothetical protein [Ancylobacter oerskovii]